MGTFVTTQGHQGSWLGLPDYGFTETAQNIANKLVSPFVGGYNLPMSSSGGSNLFSRPSSYAQQAGQVLGQYTTADNTTTIPSTPRDTTLQQGFVNQTAGPGGAYPIKPSFGTPQNNSNQSTPSTTQDPMSDYFRSLDDQMNSLGGYQGQQEGYVNDQYNSMVGQAVTARDKNLQQLGQSETEAKTEKATTLRDIQQDLMNSMRAGQVYLGGLGAGSSSAVGRMSGALSKSANRRVTDVNNQYGKIMSDIDMQKSNIQSVYDDQINQLSTWKAGQLKSIGDWIMQQKQSLGGMKSQAAYQQGMTALANLDSQVANWQSMLQQWALQKSNSVQEAVANLNQLGQYQVPGMNYNPMQVSGPATMANRGIYGGAPTDDQKYM